MSTKAQATRKEEQQKAARAHQKTSSKKKNGEAHENKHAGKKASYALEAQATEGAPSRKSTRASANRAKPDTNLTLREERRKTSPETRFRKAKARATGVRSSASA